MKKLTKIVLLLCLITFSGCKNETAKKPVAEKETASKKDRQLNSVVKKIDEIIIDGIANEKTWKNSPWLPINQVWLGNTTDSTDFFGQYKLSWSKSGLYVLVEITDDVLRDVFENPLESWWDEDCVEIFIDEDNSGGNHQFNHNAFAYHIGLNGDVVDLDSKDTPKLFNNHIESEMSIVKENTAIWEFKISVFPDTYTFKGDQTALSLHSNKKIGFAIAYCDNDTSETRENFFGSVVVDGNDKNRGWIDATIFGTIVLKNHH